MFKKKLKILLLIYFSALLLVALWLQIDRILPRRESFSRNVVRHYITSLRSKVPLVSYKDISEFEEAIQKLVDEGKVSADADFTKKGYIVKLEDVLSLDQRKKIIFSDGLPLSPDEGRMKTEGCKENRIAFFSSKNGEVVLYICRAGVLDAKRPYLFYRDN